MIWKLLLACIVLFQSDVDDLGVSGELVFPLDAQHNHAPGIAELPNGELLVSWYRGSGERKADDVQVLGSRKPVGGSWSSPFLMADYPGFPDCNTCLFVDSSDRVWMFWPLIVANSWESCLTFAAMSDDYGAPGSPKWSRKELVLLKPADFSAEFRQKLDRFMADTKVKLDEKQQKEVDELMGRLDDKLYQRLGWQPRCKPTALRDGRWLLPLYSDTFSISIMAISDDQGSTWRASGPLIGFGNIQASVLERRDGSLVAYMRENGFTGKFELVNLRIEVKPGGCVFHGSAQSRIRSRCSAAQEWPLVIDLQRYPRGASSTGGIAFRG